MSFGAAFVHVGLLSLSIILFNLTYASPIHPGDGKLSRNVWRMCIVVFSLVALLLAADAGVFIMLAGLVAVNVLYAAQYRWASDRRHRIVAGHLEGSAVLISATYLITAYLPSWIFYEVKHGVPAAAIFMTFITVVSIVCTYTVPGRAVWSAGRR